MLNPSQTKDSSRMMELSIVTIAIWTNKNTCYKKGRDCTGPIKTADTKEGGKTVKPVLHDLLYNTG